jgi:hypothetical protein
MSAGVILLGLDVSLSTSLLVRFMIPSRWECSGDWMTWTVLDMTGHFLLAVIAQVPSACVVDGRNLYVCSLCNGGALGDVLNIYHDEIRT